MNPANWPRARPLEERLLRVDPYRGTFEDRCLAELPDLLRPGDLVVVNDAATLPASLHGTTAGPAARKRTIAGSGAAGEIIEARLLGHCGDDRGREWTAVLFGAGDWRMRTEDRPPPPVVTPGDLLRFGDLTAAVRAVSPLSPRLVELTFDRDGAALWQALYRQGRPVQYSYVRAPLQLWHVQTAYGARPWALEPPSAGRPLRWGLLEALRRRGVALAWVTHAAGLSSTGDADLDARLPLDERFEVPAETVEAVSRARLSARRVVAVGTTVVRALEAAAGQAGRLQPLAGVTRVRIGPGFHPRVVDGLLTGLHEPETSHFTLLAAFAPVELLRTAHRHAEAEGYLCHEFGDSSLVLREASVVW